MLAATGLVAVALLGWQVIPVNLERACTLKDSPYLLACPRPGDPVVALRSRLSANPGDAAAFVELARIDDPRTRPGALLAASLMAPNNPNVQMLQAAAALERQDLPAAIVLLVNLSQHHNNDRAAQALASLVAAGHGALLEPHVTAGSRWVQPVLAQMSQSGGSFATALSLVAHALSRKAIEPAAVSAYISQLKAARAWTDAYALWLTLHGKGLPTLYNASFDNPFVPDAFDWEVNMPAPLSRAGALLDRTGSEGRGAVLGVRFTGRSIALPMLRQHLFIGEGRHRLKGVYRSSQLRIEGGLAWTVRCSSAPVEAGRSAGLFDTEGQWRTFEFDFTVPAGCGSVATLALETAVPADAVVGARGIAWFDAFTLERRSN